MRKKARRDALRRMAEIRRLQQASAETLLERAQVALLQECEELERRKIGMEKAEAAWHAAVARPVFMLETVPFWGQTVQHQEAQFGQARDAVERARMHQLRSVEALYLAKKNTEAAEEGARIAAGKYRQSQEEAALHDAADRHLQRKTP